MKNISAVGNYKEIGYIIGRKLENEIRQNIEVCNLKINNRGISKNNLARYADTFIGVSSNSTIRLMEGLSQGSGVSFDSILHFNAFHEFFLPEECTTFAAIGKATANGKPILLKNRDTSGDSRFDNKESHYMNKEISVVIAIKTDNGNQIIGVSKAGSAGIMMGMNKHGIAIASNFGHISEVDELKPHDFRGISGRPQMMREGLECTSAKEAVNVILAKLTESPMKVPGILFVIDSANIFVIEGSTANDMFAVQHITDGAISRSNHFQMLSQFNSEKDISSICRRIRANELIRQNYGNLSKERLKEFSMDHNNGPGNNSICRHSSNPLDSVTVSAAIMEVDPDNPQCSTIDIALGSPCWAWNNVDGHISIKMSDDVEKIPQNFFDGIPFKKYLKDGAFDR